MVLLAVFADCFALRRITAPNLTTFLFECMLIPAIGRVPVGTFRLFLFFSEVLAVWELKGLARRIIGAQQAGSRRGWLYRHVECQPPMTFTCV